MGFLEGGGGVGRVTRAFVTYDVGSGVVIDYGNSNKINGIIN